jgi:hypothetical protein
MMTKRRTWTALITLTLAALLLAACGLNLERNPDGSLRLETTMSEDSLQDEIAWAIADPLITNFTVDLRDGYVYVTADRKRVGSDVVDTMSFRLTLGAAYGHMTAVISDVVVDGFPVDEAHIDVWNQSIATRLERAGKRNEDSTLQEVLVEENSFKMVWHIETPRSKGE